MLKATSVKKGEGLGENGWWRYVEGRSI